jgi:hypothetical protein
MKILGFEHNEGADGTSLQGYVTTTYAELVAKFGEPTFTNGDKVTAEWVLDFKVVKPGEETRTLTMLLQLSMIGKSMILQWAVIVGILVARTWTQWKQ